ncbi:MAG: YicC family protein, partial [Planctomycetales bacterium]|nr:YicC family protein [Planctomycetales bacterium]NIP70177.1 YicC family protein [Planctomycetales bacterium]
NNRFLKISVTCSDRYTALESDVQTAVRKFIRRGSVFVTVKLDRQGSTELYRINSSVLAGYRDQLNALEPDQPPVSYVSLLNLPGVIDDGSLADDRHEQWWPVIETALNEALSKLVAMRQQEGRNMASDLEANCQSIRTLLDAVQQRAPNVIQEYQQRLADRLNQMLAPHEITV